MNSHSFLCDTRQQQVVLFSMFFFQVKAAEFDLINFSLLGECGHQPAVRVWDLQSEPQSSHLGVTPQPQQVAEFLGHKFGVNCVVSKPF